MSWLPAAWASPNLQFAKVETRAFAGTNACVRVLERIIMSMQELISGQLRLVKVNSSRISDLRPGSQVFVLSALSAQRKILGQFHNVKSVQADTVMNLNIPAPPSSMKYPFIIFAVVTLAPGHAHKPGRPIGF
jgi:hypothetical protein